ncbi:uncharacterized protein FMAN_02462 [Fusarium mangiferae]|uniref:Uncharacterized protein n=1 Tax=Fusarium mangiferae TaxID=192010 RepID=A0A1L7TVB6_FUSMA|nr:uncharacterized protein FMAN_02462 [Fusarium mangiferae]CVK99655.1 uncharacterized protein FMAN_02462 [Fusarium mangiferae]
MSFQTILPSIEVDDSHVAGHQVELVTMHQILLEDDDDTESNQTIGSSRKRSRSRSSTSFPSSEEHDDVDSPESAMDEFTNVEFDRQASPYFIAREAMLKAEPVNCSCYLFEHVDRRNEGEWSPFVLLEMQNIHLTDGSQKNDCQKETQARRSRQRHGTPSPTTTHTSESPVVTKLRPVPQGAPRLIEKKGQYTIRKGVRIRDYKLPGPSPWPCALPSNSLEYQCRDGFDVKEVSLGYPQPMVIRIRENVHEPTLGNHKGLKSRSPSLGTTEIV